jgi:hypothetical protein
MDRPVGLNDCEPHIAVIRNVPERVDLMPHGLEPEHVALEFRFDLAQIPTIMLVGDMGEEPCTASSDAKILSIMRSF